MNHGQVCPFEPRLCQNVATASRNPLGTPPDPQTLKKLKRFENYIFCSFLYLSPYCPLLALTGKGCCAVESTSGAIYISCGRA